MLFICDSWMNIQFNDGVLLSHENTEKLAGRYFSHCKPVRSTQEANDLEAARKLWEVSEEWMKGLSSSTAQTANEKQLNVFNVALSKDSNLTKLVSDIHIGYLCIKKAVRHLIFIIIIFFKP